MTSLITVRKQVKDIKNRISPKPPKDVTWINCFGTNDQPHGKYRYRIIHLLTGKIDPVPEDEEIYILKKHYEEQVPQHAKRRYINSSSSSSWDYDWSTFEAFLKAHECHCGREHPFYDSSYSFKNRVVI